MLRVLAVDDEAPAVEELAGLLRADPRIEQVTIAGDAAEALRDLGQMVASGQRLDAVFLDIWMDGLNGLDFTRLLSGFAQPPAVVFVTARDDYALAAYEVGAVDYLLKPVRPERLAEAVRRVVDFVRRGDHRMHPPDCGHSAEDPAPGGPAEDELIPVELGGRTRMVARSLVSYVEAHGDYVRMHTAEGSYLVRMSLGSLARRWEPAGFIRIHRSTLISVAHIRELRFDGGRVAVQVGEQTLQVSRRHSRRVRDLLIRRFRDDGSRG